MAYQTLYVYFLHFSENTVQNNDVYVLLLHFLAYSLALDVPLPLLHRELLLGLTLLLGHSDVHHLTLEHKILEEVVFFLQPNLASFLVKNAVYCICQTILRCKKMNFT
jgi:hypothetical protein